MIDVSANGLVNDARFVRGSMGAGGYIVTLTEGDVTEADVGKRFTLADVNISGALILAVHSATSFSIDAENTWTPTGDSPELPGIIGTDNREAFQTLIDESEIGTAFKFAGHFLFHGGVTLKNHQSIIGVGGGNPVGDDYYNPATFGTRLYQSKVDSSVRFLEWPSNSRGGYVGNLMLCGNQSSVAKTAGTLIYPGYFGGGFIAENVSASYARIGFDGHYGNGCKVIGGHWQQFDLVAIVMRGGVGFVARDALVANSANGFSLLDLAGARIDVPLLDECTDRNIVLSGCTGVDIAVGLMYTATGDNSRSVKFSDSSDCRLSVRRAERFGKTNTAHTTPTGSALVEVGAGCERIALEGASDPLRAYSQQVIDGGVNTVDGIVEI